MSNAIVLRFAVLPRKLTREVLRELLFILLFMIWAPQTMKRLLRKPRRQKGIKGSRRALERVETLSLAS